MRNLLVIELSFILIAFFILINSSGLSQTPVNMITNQYVNNLSNDQYVAIYQEFHENSTVIGETSNVQPNKLLPGTPAPFDYDGSLGYVFEQPTNNESLKIFYGTYRYYLNPESYNFSYSFGGVYEFPNTLESNITILSIDNNGTINANYNNQLFTIKIGETWQSPTIIRTEKSVQYSSLWLVVNKGMHNKSNLTPSFRVPYMGSPTPSPSIGVEGVVSIAIGALLFSILRKRFESN